MIGSSLNSVRTRTKLELSEGLTKLSLHVVESPYLLRKGSLECCSLGIELFRSDRQQEFLRYCRRIAQDEDEGGSLQTSGRGGLRSLLSGRKGQHVHPETEPRRFHPKH